MVPLEPWRNSTPFFGAAAFCGTKIGNFWTSLTLSSLTTWSTHLSKRRPLRRTSSKRQIMEIIEVDHVEETNSEGHWGRTKLEALNVGTVPAFEMQNVGTVPTFKMHNVGTVPTIKIHNVRTVPTYKTHNIGTKLSYAILILELDWIELNWKVKIFMKMKTTFKWRRQNKWKQPKKERLPKKWRRHRKWRKPKK